MIHSISHFYHKTINAFKVGYLAFKFPEAFSEGNIKMITSLFVLIFKVANEDRHIMSHVAYIHPVEGEKQIVSIWAGAGMDADPTKSIAQLFKENATLKAELAKLANQTT
jgi:hypothetical protein